MKPSCGRSESSDQRHLPTLERFLKAQASLRRGCRLSLLALLGRTFGAQSCRNLAISPTIGVKLQEYERSEDGMLALRSGDMVAAQAAAKALEAFVGAVMATWFLRRMIVQFFVTFKS